MKPQSKHRKSDRQPPVREVGGNLEGFTLMEMMGMLTIIGLIAGVMTPNLAQRIRRMKEAEDAAEVTAIGSALLTYASTYQKIPGAPTWSAIVSPILGMSRQDVLYAIPGDASTVRVYLIHPSSQPSTVSGGTFADPLWTQGGSGASQVSEGRVMILSVYRSGLPMPVSSGVTPNTNAFENVWNWYNDPAVVPAFLRYLGSAIPASVRLTGLSMSRSTHGWTVQLEGATKEQGSRYLDLLDALETELSQGVFRVRVSDSSQRRSLQGTSAIMVQSPETRGLRVGLASDERTFFVTGLID